MEWGAYCIDVVVEWGSVCGSELAESLCYEWESRGVGVGVGVGVH